jgi:hypothetical protein
MGAAYPSATSGGYASNLAPPANYGTGFTQQPAGPYSYGTAPVPGGWNPTYSSPAAQPPQNQQYGMGYNSTQTSAPSGYTPPVNWQAPRPPNQ